MLETNAPKANSLQRICIRCGDANSVSLSLCASCGFDLTSDLQRDYDFYRDGVPLDAPTGVGERQAQRDAATMRRRAGTQPGVGNPDWQPYRDAAPAESSEPTAQATMDLGAAVLEAVFQPTPTPTKVTRDLGPLDALVLDTPEPAMADPVGWSPTKALRMEPAVVVGTKRAPSTSVNKTADQSLVGVVHDWSQSPVAESRRSTAVTDTPKSRPVMASSAVTYAPMASPPYPTPESVAVTAPELPSAQSTTETLLTEQVVKTEPVSQRNHIRKGATTYVDAVQSSVRRSEIEWWSRDAAMPLAVAVGVVTLVLFALM